MKPSETFKRHTKSRDAREAQKEVDMDMNPMVDLAFLLLTFFMLTTTLSRPNSMELVMPAQDTEQVTEPMAVKESKTLVLVPGADDKLHYYRGITDAVMNELDYFPGNLEALLTSVKAEVPDVMVFIKPHEQSKYEHLVAVLDALNATELRRYAFDNYGELEETLMERAAAQ